MKNTSDSFDRRRFLKGEIGTILNTTGLPATFAQTNYGGTGKKRGDEGDSGNQSIIRL